MRLSGFMWDSETPTGRTPNPRQNTPLNPQNAGFRTQKHRVLDPPGHGHDRHSPNGYAASFFALTLLACGAQAVVASRPDVKYSLS